jgi:hypothetical protein
MGAGLAQGHGGPIVGKFPVGAPLPKSPYEGGKQRRHFTLSNQAYGHLGLIAQEAGLSRSETLERLIRCQHISEGRFVFSDGAWPEVTDFSIVPHETL